ncbi:MAG: phosphoribosylamine--glycine ligase [Rhodothermales bacterium]
MRILIVGGGGREHAIAWSLAESRKSVELFVAPGNAGTEELGTNVDIEASDVEGLVQFAIDRSIDLTIVGPEKPLVLGIADRFEDEGLLVVGPTAGAARLEGSKAFSKAFMKRHAIPTAAHRTFEAAQFDDAAAYIREQGAPIVVKASGLAAGKGAIVCETVDEALDALTAILRDREFGAAGEEVVVESFMVGEEASVFALADGRNYVLLAPAQDHKQIGEGDTGPNTGGMGAYAPAPIVTDEVMDEVRRRIIEPTLEGMAADGHPYRGVLYCGLMITDEGPKVVEYNCRLGDPEAQVVLPLLMEDAVDVFDAAARGDLDALGVTMRTGSAACVVMASGGYPGAYETGYPIDGLDEAARAPYVTVFHAGTGTDDDGRVVTAGGRVLGVTALGDDLREALDRAYDAVDQISFHDAQFRRDIGRKGLTA